MTLDRVLNIAITLVVLVVGMIVVRRELRTTAPPVGQSFHSEPPTLIADFSSIVQASLLLGPANAPVVIAVFEDFECPYCKRFHETTLAAIQDRYPQQIALAFVHFPLPNHRFARPAAQALECAAMEGRGQEFVKVVFAAQDSLGLITWGELGRRVGVADTLSFQRCVNDPDVFSRINQGMELGTELDVLGTPTVIVNGIRFFTAPSESKLVQIIDSIFVSLRQ